jgi:sugar O-acyltransferase (sialic acid O-acetyltransferase NeuD family)
VNELLIVGAGDHGRVMADVARAAGWTVVGFLHPDAMDGPSPAVDGIAVLGSLDEPVGAAREVDGAFVVALGANAAREEAYKRALDRGWRPATLIHPSVILLGGAGIGPGSQVCAGAIVGVDAVIGADVIVNTAATVDHDCRIGDHAFIGPGAHLAGRVTAGAGVHIGIGAVVREGCTIGDRAYVAAGAVVVRDVPAGTRVAGVPARPMDSHSASQEDA